MNNLELELHLFPNNVHFVYQVSTDKFVLIDEAIQKYFAADVSNSASVLQTIYEDDLIVLRDAYKGMLSNQFNGSIKFRTQKDGLQYWCSVTPFIYRQGEEQFICGTLVDISAEVENMEAITKYTNKKNSILHMLAHDLRGPLNIANSLMKSVDNGITDPKALSKTASISLILEQAIELIENLTQREFLEAVDVALVKHRIDITEKLGDYIEECKRSSALADRNFYLNAPDHRVLLNLDESKFMQVVNNLITNALKFTHDGGNIRLRIDEISDAVNLIFEDDGIGIPGDLMPHIFDPHTRSGRIGLRGEKSTGLGLSIVKTIIDWHKGSIMCESEEGKGTRFTVRFPKLER